MKLCAWSIVVLVTLIGAWRMVALQRNELLSRLSGSQPNTIEWNAAFVRHAAVFVVLPLLAAVVGLFPELGDSVAAHLGSFCHLVAAGG